MAGPWRAVVQQAVVVGVAALVACDDAPPPTPTSLAPTALPRPPAAPAAVVAPPPAPAPVATEPAAPAIPPTDAGAALKEEPPRLVTPVIVAKYLAFLRAYIPAAQKLMDDSAASFAKNPRGVAKGSASGPVSMAARLQVRNADIRAALVRERDTAGLSYEQLEAVTHLVEEVLRIQPGGAGFAGGLKKGGASLPEATRKGLEHTLGSAEGDPEDVQTLENQRRDWGDEAVNAVLAKLEQLRPLALKRQDFERF